MANGNLFNPYRFLTDTSTTASSGFNFTNPVNLPVNINDPNRFGQMDAKLDLTKGGAKSGSASSVTLGGDGGDVEDKGLTSGQAGGIGMIAEGLGNVLTGVIGGRARRREQRAAREQLRERMRSFENMDYYGTVMANPYEDMTVNQLQAQFQARQSQQSLANTLGALQGAAGGSGVAGLAQAMAQQQAMNMSQISANIGQQESRNQQLIGQGEYMRSLAVERAEQRVRDKNETLLVLATQRKAIADQARKDATTALAGGVGQIIAGGAQMAIGAG
tara:strand:+ start:5116 stop:5940 length:825 start_codon:yes stop_codon:yes gene_type:complete